jgi:hypothetical protein
MVQTAQITIRRGKTYADRLRVYKVSVDGNAVASVRVGESVTVPISPGRHSLGMLIDWCGSETIEFEAAPQQHMVFECGSNLAGWRLLLILFYVVYRTNRYLWLRRAA